MVNAVSVVATAVGFGCFVLSARLFKSAAAARRVARSDDPEFVLDPTREDPPDDEIDATALERGFMLLVFGGLALVFAAISL
ncbi:hypothetical protein E6P09_02865 [Haloferax mediterranei ATCC 33500]|uniref:Uncharacterized protein n=1 Tax=Haloferax mediterranei (strain ATCC 33500 / DSM 1411 / JCM 8866 / NBRC 14739 / NCIMB 2177 / R-4) TaxID=523841 RepID=I3R8T9_HALMT|nr:hypothetical protein [Haloferax mediterranei]AFK20649.2 hypothetical protein HFX_2985 [Haloferax mediterranei ATCC 33500]AHZ22866.1 hypothetical protein BM92_09545 [Haloferax mediterranei ATCC 33500]MDX5987788.1 hypothetical protein [Haloferax mediterranei ATCC 33500]QCQ74266.1 hypothetical protein E6P09_02865 [Haloferax mediterranei ATCC 33500]